MSTTRSCCPGLFQLKVGNFYIALAGEPDRIHVLKIIRRYMKPDQRVFVGVVAPIDPHVETPEEVRDRVVRSSRVHPGRATGHDRRLRLLAVLRRHLDEPRYGVRKDSRACRGDRARRRCGSESRSGHSGRRGQTAAVGGAAERKRDSACPPARRGRAPSVRKMPSAKVRSVSTPP